jgi:diguanylate cyclase (GGDEF)-like protein
MALTDPLTGLANRRFMTERANYYFEQSQANRQNLSLVMIDVDDFKRINDKCGHIIGDKVLKSLGNILQTYSVEPVLAGRWGGEEFLLLLPDHNIEKALDIAEAIRKEVETSSIRDNSTLPSIRVSIGVAQLSKQHKHLDDLLVSADRGLYHAKYSGKNRVSIVDF